MQARLTLVVDGYSAPVTGGNFVRNVVEGTYCDARLRVDQGAALAGRGAITGTPPPPLPRTARAPADCHTAD